MILPSYTSKQIPWLPRTFEGAQIHTTDSSGRRRQDDGQQSYGPWSGHLCLLVLGKGEYQDTSHAGYSRILVQIGYTGDGKPLPAFHRPMICSLAYLTRLDTCCVSLVWTRARQFLMSLRGRVTRKGFSLAWLFRVSMVWSLTLITGPMWIPRGRSTFVGRPALCGRTHTMVYLWLESQVKEFAGIFRRLCKAEDRCQVMRDDNLPNVTAPTRPCVVYNGHTYVMNNTVRSNSQMPRHLISDAHELINEIPTPLSLSTI